MSLRLPSLTHLRCFESAARHQSFTATAEELGMTQGAVSKKIKELETDVGFDLFQRVGRGVVLTAAGRSFAENLTRDLEGLKATVQDAVAAGAGKSTLSIATLPTFANLWLIPRLPAFFELHPEIEVSLSTRLVPFEFDTEPFDLAFHYGTENWPGTTMRHLFGEQMVAVCSPAFRDHHGLDNLANLDNVPLLHISTRSDSWPDWIERAGGVARPRKDGRYFDQHSMVISAAKASLGAAIVPLVVVAQELEAGHLVRLGETTLTTEKSYYLVRPAGYKSEPARAFETWVTQQAQKTRPRP
ncbi:LysR substrate-binding domain-containing protein [Shimia sp. CNT1-13L.2]|uniref:LysR substrate-binding domain-containing protein n=1 Tax=Shimia sp. CNT1-13L.2 TaxID=2959663 RepID=UPI0020CE5AB7|nr:LysR substrate-binding domain-containing protein [Shimia sp. CNT1-13L.2]MCP9484149.1 LysR substrate-binding domain-containing protein [Shimia sp. CNT1-13L.2]